MSACVSVLILKAWGLKTLSNSRKTACGARTCDTLSFSCLLSVISTSLKHLVCVASQWQTIKTHISSRYSCNQSTTSWFTASTRSARTQKGISNGYQCHKLSLVLPVWLLELKWYQEVFLALTHTDIAPIKCRPVPKIHSPWGMAKFWVLMWPKNTWITYISSFRPMTHAGILAKESKKSQCTDNFPH